MSFNPSPIDWNLKLAHPTARISLIYERLFASVIEDLRERGLSPLHLVALGMTDIRLTAMPNLNTANINTKCGFGRTPLCWAVVRKDTQAVQSLISKGAALDIVDRGGSTALHYAAETGCVLSLWTMIDAAKQTGSRDSESHLTARNPATTSFA